MVMGRTSATGRVCPDEGTESGEIVSYVRKSQISFANRAGIQNELGFIRLKSVSLMLHRGTYSILEWDEARQFYTMVTARQILGK
jgi:hypothetical protein